MCREKVKRKKPKFIVTGAAIYMDLYQLLFKHICYTGSNPAISYIIELHVTYM